MPENEWTRERLAVLVAAIITCVWAVSFLFDAFSSYEQNTAITPIMLSVAGWLFGADLLKRTKSDNGNGNGNGNGGQGTGQGNGKASNDRPS